MKIPGAIATHRMPNSRQFPRNGQGHARDARLGGGVGDLTDLAFEGCDRGRVNDHAALAFFIRRVGLHDGRRGFVAQERADEIHADHLLEEIAAHRTVLAQKFSGADDPRAIDQEIDAAQGRARRFNGGRYLASTETSHLKNAAPSLLGRSLARRPPANQVSRPCRRRRSTRSATALPRPDAPPVMTASVSLKFMDY